jgi:hypothetical protein
MLQRLFSSSDLRTTSLGKTYQDASILARIPFSVSTPLAEKMLAGFLAGTRITLVELSAIESCSAKSNRLALHTHLVERCFSMLNFSAERREEYSTYHRDVVVRFLVLRASKGEAKAREVLELLESRAKLMRAVPDSRISSFPKDTQDVQRYILCWLGTVAEACRAADTMLKESAAPDPFASCSSDVVLFQLLHSVARQLGLSLLEEAQVFAVTGQRQASEDTLGGYRFELTRPPLENKCPRPDGNRPQLTQIQSPWMLMVESGGHQGTAFIGDFRARLGKAYSLCVEALATLRQHNLGVSRLEVARDNLRAVQPLMARNDVATLLLARFFWGTTAYYYFCLNDMPQAEVILDRAGESLRRAIDSEHCLIPCALLNSDIPLQHARIARRQGNWPRVVAELSLLSDFESGRRPLQLRSDGTSVTYAFIEAMCCLGLDLKGSEGQAVRDYLDEGYRIPQLDRWIRSFYLYKYL